MKIGLDRIPPKTGRIERLKWIAGKDIGDTRQ